MFERIRASRSLFPFFKNLDKDYREAVERLRWSPEKMQELSLEKVKKIVDHAYLNTEFYHEEFKKVGYKPGSIEKLSDLEFLPILTKKKLREAINNKTIFPKDTEFKKLLKTSTTGSTGEPLTLYFDKQCLVARNINIVRAYSIAGMKPFERHLQIWRKKKVNIVRRVKSFLGLFKAIFIVDIYDLNGSAINNKNLKNIVEEIREFKPDTIESYVSALYVLAIYLKMNNINDIRPKRIICCAEYLPHSVWDELREIFQCPVYNMYGSTEFSLASLSTDDSSKKMFFMDDFYWTEVVDEENKQVEPGNIGRMLLTDYNSYSMPLIRHEIGDMAEMSSDFYGPFRTAQEIVGRTNDVFVLPNKKLVFSHSWQVYVRDIPGLERFKIIQKKLDKIDIKLLPYDKQLLTKNLDIIKKRLHEAVGDEVVFNIEIVDNLPLDTGEKFRAVESKIDWRKYI